MTSSGHVTSSGSCPINSPWALSYRLSIGTIPLSGFVSEIFNLAPKLRQRLLRDDVINGRHLGFDATGCMSNRSAIPENPTLGSNAKLIGRSVAEIWLWNAKFDDVINKVRIHYPWGPLIFPMLGLKYQLIPTRTAGEEAFWKCGHTDRHPDRQTQNWL